LRLLQTTPNVHMEHIPGTQMYLEICSNYIDIFLFHRIDLRSTIALAFKVSFFFRLWRLWFSHGDHSVFENTKKLCPTDHFVNQQCFIDIQMSCHFVALLICHFKDRYSHLPTLLHLTGNDACKRIFSKIGRMVGLKRAYDFHGHSS
jgi:hypothetical protein